MITFVHVSGAREGGVDRIEGDGFLMGRGPECAVRFHAEHDRAVGKIHAEVESRNGRYLLCDRDSRNGCYVNGRLVKEVFLRHGDVIRLGADGPQLRVDLTGGEVSSVLRAMRRKRWRPVWIPVVLLLLVGVGLSGLWAKRQLDRRLQTVEDEKASVDQEIDALLAVMSEGATTLEEIAARYDRMVELEQRAEGVRPRRSAVDDDTMDGQVDEVLEAFGEPTYRVPASFREAVRQRVGMWLGTDQLSEIFCATEAHMPAVRATFARYGFPDVLAFLPWVLGGGGVGSLAQGKAGLWAVGEDEGRALGLIDDDGEDRRADPLASTEAIAELLQRELETLGTSSVLLATVARDPDISATVESLREQGQWSRHRRNVRFLWLAEMLDDGARQTIPSLVAAAVVGRNPDRFGVSSITCSAVSADLSEGDSSGGDGDRPGQ